jgi:hypothetical protein
MPQAPKKIANSGLHNWPHPKGEKMHPGSKFLQISMQRPKLVVISLAVITLVLGSLISLVQVDTDPENMLNKNEAVRLFHDLTKKEFNLHDVVVLGVVNEKDPDGVFNPATLKKVQELSDFVMHLRDPKNPERRVITQDIIAPGNVESIEQSGPGQISFEWLMQKAPATRAEALKIRAAVMANPLLKGTLVSEDSKAMGIYIPISTKDFAHAVRQQLLEKIASLKAGEDKFYITGLPVAEDTFGKEMFVQMAISAPLAMLTIFLLMLLFFKQLNLIVAPMLIAMMTVIGTMGLLIGSGHTLHIMSSMIPIFLMPIAVVDSIHILSEFFDQYQKTRDRRQTIETVLGHLFMPMLYTSLTSAAGFASLALTPIPPVQAFGLFVALGIMGAWLLTIIFIPAYIMLMSEKSLENFGLAGKRKGAAKTSIIERHLAWIGRISYRQAKFVIIFNLAILTLAGFGINKIVINDNPVKWFKKSHEIRVADRVLNQHFGGTYEAYLILEADGGDETAAGAASWLQEYLEKNLSDRKPIQAAALSQITEALATAASARDLGVKLMEIWQAERDNIPLDNEEDYEAWAKAVDGLDAMRNRDEIFKRPEVLRYVETLQQRLLGDGDVGKSNSVTDVVKKVHQELFEGQISHFRVPDSVNGVAQCLISFQNSHKPDDLWHLVTPDYKKANIWIQLKSGDNTDMQRVVADVEDFFTANPPPLALKHNWAGLTYINVVWQDKMVSGMRDSFMGSFIIVFLMMAILFRSPSWGLLAMVPLTVTIAFIYGIIGLIGKDFDMPVAVLSSLTLGLAVDFAIHFLERCRATYKKTGSWKETLDIMFEEPARAIARNTIVIAIGFTPLLAAPLIPYQTVGIFLATIMLYSGLATLWILPAVLTVFKPWFFGSREVARCK